MPEDNAALIAALLREREGYVVHDRADRVTAVDAELERLGHTAKRSEPKPLQPETAALAAPERAASPAPKRKESHS